MAARSHILPRTTVPQCVPLPSLPSFFNFPRTAKSSLGDGPLVGIDFSLFYLLSSFLHSLTQFGAILSPTPKTLQGRVIDPPKLAYGGDHNTSKENRVVSPFNGKWYMNSKKDAHIKRQFRSPAAIGKVAVIVDDDCDRRTAVDSLHSLLDQAFKLGMQVSSSNNQLHQQVFDKRKDDAPDDAVSQAVAKERPEFVFWFVLSLFPPPSLH
jgi:hypothetical protein